MAVFSVEVKDDVSGSAKAASSSLDQLLASLNATASASDAADAGLGSLDKMLNDLNKQNLDFHTSSDDLTASLQKQAKGIDTVSTESANMNSVMKGAADGAQKLFKGTENLSSQMGAAVLPTTSLSDALSGMGGPIGSLVEMFSNPLSAAIALATAAITAFIATMSEAVATAVRITEQRDEIVATFDALGKGAGAGQKTLDMLDQLSSQLPFTIDQLSTMAKKLEAAGITSAPELERGIRAVAAATAIMGDAGGQAAQTLIARFAEAAATGAKITIDRRLLNQMAASGVSAEALAAQLGVPVDKLNKMSIAADKMGDALQKALIEKGAGAIENMQGDWDTIVAKFHESIGNLFSDMAPAVQPLMQAIKGIADMFAKTSAAGTIMRTVLTPIFSALFTIATGFVDTIHGAFSAMVNVVLRLAIGLAPVVNGFKKLFGSGAGAKLLQTILRGIGIALGAIVVVIAAVVGAFGLILGTIGAVIGGFVGLLGAIVGFVAGATGALLEWVTSAPKAASDFISGLVGGITNGISSVINAVKGLGSSAVSALSSVLQMHSPSKVMERMGGFISGGLAGGIEDGQSSVASAASGLAGAAIGGTISGGASAGGGGQGGSKAIVINATITNNGTGSTGEAIAMTEAAVTLIFERLAGEQGLLAPA